MLTWPRDLTRQVLHGALAAGWGLGVASLAYEPVGFGSHHWRLRDTAGGEWFVTADDLDTKRWLGATRDEAYDGLAAALATAIALEGLGFVVGPVPPAPWRAGDRYALAVYPLLDVTAGAAAEAGPLLAALHAAAPPPAARPLDVTAPARAVRAALAEIDEPWHGGPYAEPARAALAEAAAYVGALLRTFDALAAANPGPLVVTHGEPHPGNVLATADGPRLVDWDTVALASPERDTWWLADAASYVAAGGSPPDPRRVELYRVRWTLDDVASFVAALRAPHGDTEDAAASLRYLVANLTPPPPT